MQVLNLKKYIFHGLDECLSNSTKYGVDVNLDNSLNSYLRSSSTVSFFLVLLRYHSIRSLSHLGDDAQVLLFLNAFCLC